MADITEYLSALHVDIPYTLPPSEAEGVPIEILVGTNESVLIDNSPVDIKTGTDEPILIDASPVEILNDNGPVINLPPKNTRMMCIQFDDGRAEHFDLVVPILDQYGVKGSFGIPYNSDLGLRPEDLLTMQNDGHELQSHSTISSNPSGYWGLLDGGVPADYQNGYGGELTWEEFWQANIIDYAANNGLRPFEAWNQPGGADQSWNENLRTFMISKRMKYIAGRVGLSYIEGLNLHPYFVYDPMSLGRGGIVSWGLNGGATPEEELSIVCGIIANDIAMGTVPIPLWHLVSELDGSADGLRGVLQFASDNNIEVVVIAEALRRCRNGAYYKPLAGVEAMSNGDFQSSINDPTRPDGWNNTLYVTGAVNDEQPLEQVVLLEDANAYTKIYGLKPGTYRYSARVKAVDYGVTSLFRCLLQESIVDDSTWQYSLSTPLGTQTLVGYTACDEWTDVSGDFTVHEKCDSLQIYQRCSKGGAYLCRIPGTFMLERIGD